jgi:kumamolisin
MTTSKSTVVGGSRRVALSGAKALGPANEHAVIDVLVKVRRKKDIGKLEARPKTAMSRDAVGSSYGASAADLKTVADTFRKLGLEVVSTDAATRSVDLSGTVGEMEKAFQVKLFDYEHPDGNYRGRVGDLFVPAALHDIVTGVFGLDDRRVARRRRQHVQRGAAKDPSSVPSSWYVPATLGARYNFPPGDGSGQAAGLLEFGGGYFPADLQRFCGLAGVSQPTVVPISVDGTSTSAKDGAEGEVMLDIEVIAGVCPKATIAVYFAHWGEKGWIKALDAAVHDAQNKPSVISASWGSPEDTDIWTGQAMSEINETLKDAAMAGITVCIAAGDDGSSDADQDGHAHVDFPSSSPYVLAVGGTTIPKKTAPLPDIVWFEGNGLRQQNNPNSGSTGGGVSTVFPRPAWQNGISITSVNPGAIVGRVTPDLAANADWTASPYLLCVDGGSEPNGGTSAASPLVAAMVTLINGQLGGGAKVGYLTPLLYQSGAGGQPVGASACTDIVSGGNKTAQAGGYTAQPGYDAVSGWGTPNGVKLQQAISSINAPPAVAGARAHAHAHG